MSVFYQYARFAGDTINGTGNPFHAGSDLRKKEGYNASLEPRKIYSVLPDKAAAAHGLLRVIDESEEDYLYPAEFLFRSNCHRQYGKPPSFAPIFPDWKRLTQFMPLLCCCTAVRYLLPTTAAFSALRVYLSYFWTRFLPRHDYGDKENVPDKTPYQKNYARIMP